MNKVLSLTTILFLLNCPVFAQTNVTGWGKAQWDMTSQQVKEEYPQVQPVDQETIEKAIKSCLALKTFTEEKCKTMTGQQMDNFIIGSYPFKVKFFYAENKLKKINLYYVGGEKDVKSAYFDIFEALTSRYGKPSSDILISKETWRTPDGSIELRGRYDKGFNITYQQVEQNL